MEESHRRILQASLDLFSKRGYVGTTTREIARAAEVTEVTLFRHFSSKEKLFEEVVCEYLPSPDFKQLVLMAEKMEYRHALEMIANTFFEDLRKNKALIQIMYSESRRYFELMERVYLALIKNLTELLAKYFEGLQQNGTIRKFNSATGAKAFLGMFTALFESEDFFTILNSQQNDISEVISEYIDIFTIGTIISK